MRASFHHGQEKIRVAGMLLRVQPPFLGGKKVSTGFDFQLPQRRNDWGYLLSDNFSKFYHCVIFFPRFLLAEAVNQFQWSINGSD